MPLRALNKDPSNFLDYDYCQVLSHSICERYTMGTTCSLYSKQEKDEVGTQATLFMRGAVTFLEFPPQSPQLCYQSGHKTIPTCNRA